MMGRLCAAVTAVCAGMAPGAALAASFAFTLEIEFLADLENPDLRGDLRALTPQLQPDGIPPVTQSATGSGMSSVTVGFGPASDRAGSLFTFAVRGTGMTSPVAFGTAEGGSAVLDQRLTVFNDGLEDVVLPFFLDWTLTVEASAGSWGDSSAEVTFGGAVVGTPDDPFGGGPLSVDSLSGHGPLVLSGGASGLFDLQAEGGFGEIELDFTAGGSAQTTAPIPLPAGGWLLLSGLGVLVLARRRVG